MYIKNNLSTQVAFFFRLEMHISEKRLAFKTTNRLLNRLTANELMSVPKTEVVSLMSPVTSSISKKLDGPEEKARCTVSPVMAYLILSYKIEH